MLEICQFRPEEIDEAIEGMEGLQEILVPVLRKAVGNGNGTEQDIQQFQRHVMLAKHALGALGALLEERMGEKADEPVQNQLPVLRYRPKRYERYEESGLNENGEVLYLKRVYVDEKSYAMYCPACGRRLCSRFTSYCPNCGTKIAGKP